MTEPSEPEEIDEDEGPDEILSGYRGRTPQEQMEQEIMEKDGFRRHDD